MKATRFVGIDLTDSYARNPRPVDVAILNPQNGHVDFDTFDWPARTGGNWEVLIAGIVARFCDEATVFVVDGPQALAAPQNNTRDSERYLRTPAHTPWQMPTAGTRPFAGYIRTSVEFFNALVVAGYVLAELGNSGAADANLFEAYPGAAWPVVYRDVGPLHSKATAIGCLQRRETLEATGCGFTNPGVLSHDQLDAALCAALGWRYCYPSAGDDAFGIELVRPTIPTATATGVIFRDATGVLREGRMLMPKPRQGKPKAGAKVAVDDCIPSAAITSAPSEHADTLPVCDWVYYPGRAMANHAQTHELAVQDELIVRSAYNVDGNAISNTLNLKPGETILLAYGGDGHPYRALCRCVIDDPDPPVHHGGQIFPGLKNMDQAFDLRFAAAGYDPDPILHRFTAIPLRNVVDLQHLTQNIPRKPGPMTIQRWNLVFAMPE